MEETRRKIIAFGKSTVAGLQRENINSVNSRSTGILLLCWRHSGCRALTTSMKFCKQQIYTEHDEMEKQALFLFHHVFYDANFCVSWIHLT